MTPYEEGCAADAERWDRIARTNKEQAAAIKVPKVPALMPEGMDPGDYQQLERNARRAVRQRIRASKRAAKAQRQSKMFRARSYS